jgi:phytoene dehydrogenase-like protein
MLTHQVLDPLTGDRRVEQRPAAWAACPSRLDPTLLPEGSWMAAVVRDGPLRDVNLDRTTGRG